MVVEVNSLKEITNHKCFKKNSEDEINVDKTRVKRIDKEKRKAVINWFSYDNTDDDTEEDSEEDKSEENEWNKVERKKKKVDRKKRQNVRRKLKMEETA